MVAFKTIARILLSSVVLFEAIVLILAASLKVQDLASFRNSLAAHGLIPGFLLSIAPWTILGVELAVGLSALGFIIRGEWRLAAATAAMVFLSFTLYAAALSVRPPKQPAACGCGFSSAVVESWVPIAFRSGASAGVLLIATIVLTNRSSQNEHDVELNLEMI